MIARSTLLLAVSSLALVADAAGHGSMGGPGLVYNGGPRLPPGPGTGSGGGGTIAPPTPAPGVGPRTGGAGPSSGGRKRRVTAVDGWESWWAMNREPYLTRRQAVLTPGRPGIGRSALVPQQRHDAFAALVDALSSHDPEIVDSAAIALSRLADGRDRAVAVEHLAEKLDHQITSVRQAAMLGLGVLGHRRSVPMLWSIMSDTSTGRTLIGTSTIQSRDRALAAISLGLAGGADLARDLLRTADRRDDIEVAASAVLTLGLLADASSTSVPALVVILEDARRDRRLRAAAAVSLGRLGVAAVGATTVLLDRALDKREGPRVRESCLIALGRLVEPSDGELIDKLRTVVRKERDASVRQLAWMALGRVGARGATGGVPARDGARTIARFLASELIDVDHADDMPWIALAAGACGHGLPLDDRSIRAPLVDAVRHQLKRTNHPSRFGALATAAGMLGDRDAGERLLEVFEQRHEVALRGQLAVALGMTGFDGARESLRDVLESTREGTLKVEIATALDLLGDREAARELLDQLEGSPTFASAAAAARALSRIGDERTVARLLEIIADEERSSPTRAFSIVALGRIAEKTVLPWNAPLSIDANWRLSISAQAEVLDIL